MPYPFPIPRVLNLATNLNYNSFRTDCCFTVDVFRGSSGFGLSLDGGIDTTTAFRGLIRIKRLFPYQPAWETGMIRTGDILLRANNERLTGLTNEVSGKCRNGKRLTFPNIDNILLLLWYVYDIR